MDAFLIILLILFLIAPAFFLQIFWSGVKTIFNDKNFKENFVGVPDFSARLMPKKITTEDEGSIEMVSVQLRGRLPINRARKIGFLVGIDDVTDADNPKPVISFLNVFQEAGTTIFQSYQNIGDCNPGGGFTDWSNLGGFFPEMLQPPASGNRKFLVNAQLVDVNNLIGDDTPPKTVMGRLINKDVIIWEQTFSYERVYTDKGYEEEAAHREEAQQITIRIGVAVAMSDGSFDDSEGEVIKKWITKTIAGYSEKKRESLKNIYNDAFKSAYHDASNRKLSFSDLSRLNDIGEKKTKFDALELAYEVMAADGVADPEELKMIRMIGEQLNLDMDEVEKIRSRIMITLPDDVFTDKETLEQLFGIDKNWDKGKIKAHLATEFQRWNGRMNALAEGKEKDKAQNMLNKIGEARKKYDIE